MKSACYAALCCIAMGCGGATPGKGEPKPNSGVASEQQERARRAKKAMFEALSGRLKEVMTADGAARAVTVCAEEAPGFAERVSREHQVRIGRTSLRLRNQENRAPKWASDLIAKRPENETFVDLPGERLGALLPIHMKQICVACHGPSDSLDPTVAEALAKHYPDDQATGFAEGDLRGWFWVEVPGS